jgi:uncharacterized phage-like protein YoqJ
MILMGTGHRAHSLGTSFPPMQLKLVEFATTVLTEMKPDRVVSGMATGWDQALARASRRVGIPYEAVIPFHGQEDRWHSTDRAAYRDLLSDADGIQVVVEDPTDFRQALMDRNEAMVDQSDGVLGVWDGRKYGGTFKCLCYAHDRGLRVYQLYQSWQSFVRA